MHVLSTISHIFKTICWLVWESIPFTRFGKTLNQFLQLQLQKWWIHKSLYQFFLIRSQPFTRQLRRYCSVLYYVSTFYLENVLQTINLLFSPHFSLLHLKDFVMFRCFQIAFWQKIVWVLKFHQWLAFTIRRTTNVRTIRQRSIKLQLRYFQLLTVVVFVVFVLFYSNLILIQNCTFFSLFNL